MIVHSARNSPGLAGCIQIAHGHPLLVGRRRKVHCASGQPGDASGVTCGRIASGVIRGCDFHRPVDRNRIPVGQFDARYERWMAETRNRP